MGTLNHFSAGVFEAYLKYRFDFSGRFGHLDMELFAHLDGSCFYYPRKLKLFDEKKTESMAKVPVKMKKEHLFSYEYLALVFMRSKATVYEGFRERQIEANRLKQQTETTG